MSGLVGDKGARGMPSDAPLAAFMQLEAIARAARTPLVMLLTVCSGTGSQAADVSGLQHSRRKKKVTFFVAE